MTANLKARLAKLELRLSSKEVVFSPIIVSVFDRDHAEVIGIGTSGQTVAREAGETIEALTMRGGRELCQRILLLVYAPG